MVDVDEFVGKSFRFGGRGPDAYDCYGLVRELLMRDGKPAPEQASPSEGAVIEASMATELFQNHRWVETTERPGAIVLIRAGRHISHVGYVLPFGRMIHTWEKSNGVVVERLDTWRHRIVGFYDYVA